MNTENQVTTAKAELHKIITHAVNFAVGSYTTDYDDLIHFQRELIKRINETAINWRNWSYRSDGGDIACMACYFDQPDDVQDTTCHGGHECPFILSDDTCPLGLGPKEREAATIKYEADCEAETAQDFHESFESKLGGKLNQHLFTL